MTLLVLEAVGCSPIPKELSKKELSGTYVLHYSFGVEELTINSDGTYIQIFTSKTKVENTGKWQYQKDHLLLTNALIFASPFGKQLQNPEKGNVGLSTALYYGNIVLDANPDQGVMYEKQN